MTGVQTCALPIYAPSRLSKGDIVYSAPMEHHRFVFQTHGAFIAMATQSRVQNDYENDTIRIEFEK